MIRVYCKLLRYGAAPCMLVFVLLGVSCKKFSTVGAPITNVSQENVYTTTATAAAVLNGIYAQFSRDNGGDGGIGRLFYYTALSADELTSYDPLDLNWDVTCYRNDLSKLWDVGNMWSGSYGSIYMCNAAIEGITGSSGIDEAAKGQLLGEAKFMRSLFYFYLTGMYGDVPLVLTTDYTVNLSKPRTPIADIYTQMIKDLQEAVASMGPSYMNGQLSNTTTERVRPNRATALALLARVYLYHGDWAKAEAAATELINMHDVYDVASVPLDKVFLKNSKETIWALPSVMLQDNANTGEGRTWLLPATGPSSNYPVYLSDLLLNDFEHGDQRSVYWVLHSGGYPQAYKYKADRTVTATVEYTILFRLAEQYLIRAEALIQQGKIADGIADLNIIRRRATDLTAPPADQLPALSTSLSKEDALAAVLHERRFELFTEWGHRWFDLKRTGTIDARMQVVTPLKGPVSWQPYKALYPIPNGELQLDPAMRGHQNPGYE